MPRFSISRVHVRWDGGRSEDLKDVELISPNTPGNDNKTKELLMQKLGCKSIGGVHGPIKKLD